MTDHEFTGRSDETTSRRPSTQGDVPVGYETASGNSGDSDGPEQAAEASASSAAASGCKDSASTDSGSHGQRPQETASGDASRVQETAYVMLLVQALTQIIEAAMDLPDVVGSVEFTRAIVNAAIVLQMSPSTSLPSQTETP